MSIRTSRAGSGVSQADLAATLAKKDLIAEGSTQITTAAAAGSNYLLAAGQANILSTSGASTLGVAAAGMALIDASDLAIAGKTTKLKLLVAILAGTAPGGTWTFGFHPVSISATALVMGAAVVTVAIATPAANVVSRAESADVNMPGDGLYALTVSPSAIPANNVTVQAKAFAHYL